MKRTLFFFVVSVIAFQCKAGGNLDLWGIDITETNAKIAGCKVIKIEDDKIFSQLKICSDGYTFANDKPVYTCFFGDEAACFSKATEIITAKFGFPLDVYTYNLNNPFSARTPYFNIWKYNKDDRHFVLMLFGSGEGMTLDVLHFINEKKLRAYILSTIKSFHFSVKPTLYNYLDQ